MTISVIKAKIVEVAIDTEIPYANKAGTYSGTLIEYKDDRGEFRKNATTTKVLNSNPELKTKLSALNPGDVVGLKFQKVESNGRTFNNLLDVVDASEAGTTTASSSSTGFSKGGSFNKGKSTDDVERIARQNALEAAVKVTSTPGEALKAAADFAAFILAPVTATKTTHTGTTGSATPNDEELPF